MFLPFDERALDGYWSNFIPLARYERACTHGDETKFAAPSRSPSIFFLPAPLPFSDFSCEFVRFSKRDPAKLATSSF
jgi:hypothetical protein